MTPAEAAEFLSRERHSPLRLALHGGPATPRQWASLLARTGVELEPVPPAEAEILLSHGPWPDAPASLPLVEIPRWAPSGGEARWREDFLPILTALARSPDHWLEESLRRHSPSRLVLGADLLALTNGVLAGWAEPPDALDAHGRPAPVASLLHRAGALDIPVVDAAARQLGALLCRLLSRPFNAPVWHCLPTLDIDSAGLFGRRAFPSYLRRLMAERPAAAAPFFFDAVRTRLAILKDPHCRARQVGEVLEGLGFPAAIFVQTHRWHPLDNYDLAASKELVADLLAVRRNRFHQVGLHSSYQTLQEGGRAFHRQWRQLARIVGPPHAVHRSHYLRFPAREAWSAPAGHSYVDTSLGFGSAEGFRRGTAHPFPLPGGAIELPPVVMDSTLIHHRRLTVEGAWDRCVALMDQVARHGGAFVPIWHPNNMDNYLFPGWAELFYDLLREAGRRGARKGVFTATAHALYLRQTRLESLIERAHS